MDVLGPVERRRVWSAEEKAALLAEIDVEGGRVCAFRWIVNTDSV